MSDSPVLKMVLSSTPRGLPALARRRRHRGFSLVEVVLSLGVMAFGFVGLFGLLPTGLGVFRSAIDTSIGAQIAQRIVSDIQQSDFDSLVPPRGGTVPGIQNGGLLDQYLAHPLRYFDEQGHELSSPHDPGLLYVARLRFSKPGVPNPANHTQDWFTSLPAQGPVFNPRSTTVVTIQLTNNPAKQDVSSMIDPNTFLIDPVKASAASVRIQTYSAIITSY
jgi:uncharacterized protein (TIGR02598 family)